MQVLCSFDDFKNSGNSERSNDRSDRADVDAENLQKNNTNPGRQNDQEIKDVPSIIEVRLSKGKNFDDHFNWIDESEEIVDNLQYLQNFFIHSVPRNRKDNSVETNTYENENIEGVMSCKPCDKISEFVASLLVFLLRICNEAFNQRLDIFILERCHETIVRKLFLFNVEGTDDDTDKQV